MRIYGNCSKYNEYCYEHPDNKAIWNYGPLLGDGYQLWENTSEGSPISPVFNTLDKLCEWCEENATVFGSFKDTKENWVQILSNENVCYKINKDTPLIIIN